MCRDPLTEMQPDTDDSGPITVEETLHGVRFGFRDSAWDIRFPPGWQAIRSDEDDLWCWAAADLLGRIRLRRCPRIELEVDVRNNGREVAQVEPPRVVLTPTGTQVPWFAGSAGEVLQTYGGRGVLWVQHRGSCVADAQGFELFAAPLLLRPGQGASALWRRTTVPPTSLIPEPAWLPWQRYLPMGEVLEVEHADAALTGDGLHILTTADGSHVTGEAGLHQLSFVDARGEAWVEVGWFAPLEELVGSPSALADADPNVAAWLLAGAVDAAVELDDLDVALAEALERPTAWGVLAGMRTATHTDLPVAAEVRQAARKVWESESDPGLRRLMITHGLLCGWEPQLVGEWLAAGADAMNELMAMGPQEMLASIGFGRITSSPTLQRGRAVALAEMWLSTRAESVMAAEWERAVDVTRRRLMCSLSSAPEPVDIAWLLAHSLLR